MKKIIPITDLQRQSSQIVRGLSQTGEPVVITQRGRAAAVLLSAERYSQIEEDLNRLDELEMLNLLERGITDFDEGRTVSGKEVRARLEKRYSSLKLRKSNRR
jgi:prevent-host-death family protein